MISQLYITEAVNIRNEFIALHNQLTNLEQNNMKEIYNSFIEQRKNLENIRDNDLTTKDSSDLQKSIEESLTKLDEESQRLGKIVNPINEKIEDLKKREEVLYANIKAAYPTLTDDQIVGYIKPHLS